MKTISDANRPAWQSLRVAHAILVTVLALGPGALAQEQEPEPVAPGFPAEPQRSGAKPPPLVQVSPPLTFGYVAPESIQSDYITILNDSEETIELLEARGDCECTVPIIEDMILEPGEHTDILVEFNTPAELGDVIKKIFITAAGYDAPFETGVHAEVGRAVRVNGGGNRSLIVALEGSFRLDAVDERPFLVRTINGQPTSKADFASFDPETDEPRDEYVIEYNYREMIPETLPRLVVVETDHPGAPMIGFPAFLPGALPMPSSPEWFPRKKEFLIPDLVGGERYTIPVVIAGALPKQGDKLWIQSSNPDVAADIQNLERPDYGQGMKISVGVLMRFGATGFHTTVLNVQMDGGHFATIEVFIRCEEPEAEAAGSNAPER